VARFYAIMDAGGLDVKLGLRLMRKIAIVRMARCYFTDPTYRSSHAMASRDSSLM
jgi:hypothetical protein